MTSIYSGPQTLLSQQGNASEPGSIIGKHKSAVGIGVDQARSRGRSRSCLRKQRNAVSSCTVTCCSFPSRSSRSTSDSPLRHLATCRLHWRLRRFFPGSIIRDEHDYEGT